VNVPVGVSVIVLSPMLLRERAETEADLAPSTSPGRSRSTASLLLLVTVITGGPEAGWLSTRTIGLLAASAALFGLSLLIESRSSAPLVPMRVLRSRTLVGGNIFLLAAGMSIDGMLYVLTLYAQEVLSYSTVQFGLMTATMTVMSVVGAYGGQAVVTRTGFRPVAATGMVLVGVAFVLLAQVSVDGSFLGDIFFVLLIFGTGLGSAFVASQIAALAGVAERESSLAAGLVDTSFSMGGAIGLAILSTVAAARTSEILAGVGRSDPLTAMTKDSGPRSSSRSRSRCWDWLRLCFCWADASRPSARCRRVRSPSGRRATRVVQHLSEAASRFGFSRTCRDQIADWVDSTHRCGRPRANRAAARQRHVATVMPPRFDEALEAREARTSPLSASASAIPAVTHEPCHIAERDGTGASAQTSRRSGPSRPHPAGTPRRHR
jgi:Major Facilitator Superfamily